ncbi:hypothetical protein BJX99DRAFT_253897 [Aspergillus californicus]
MHLLLLLLPSLLALTSLHLGYVQASHPAGARVTAPPTLPKIFRRQNDICPDGDYTVCPDGFGCCEFGAPCTTLSGVPSCDTGECNGLPCGEAGLCCDGLCSSSLGTDICVHATGGLGSDEDTSITLDDPTTTSAAIIPSATGTATTPTETPDSETDSDSDTTAAEGVDDTTDSPTMTSTATSDDDNETTTARPTTTGSSGDNSDDSSDSSDDTSDSSDSSNNSPDDTQSGGGDDGGSGIVSAKGSMAVLVLGLVGGAFLLY